jgi:hypothetical protein
MVPVSGDGTYPRNGNFFNLDRLKPDQLPGERVPHRCPLDRNRPIRVRPILKSTATEATELLSRDDSRWNFNSRGGEPIASDPPSFSGQNLLFVMAITSQAE